MGSPPSPNTTRFGRVILSRKQTLQDARPNLLRHPAPKPSKQWLCDGTINHVDDKPPPCVASLVCKSRELE